MSKEFDEKTSEQLLEEYGRTGDQRIKQEIVLRYVYLIKSIAIQFRGVYASFAQVEDIVNESIIVLMNAVDKYKPEKNAKFETFISKRLRGLIIDIARKQDWVPRNIRKELKEIDDATKILYDKLGRYPTDQETADYLNINIDKYIKLLARSNIYNLISLDYFLSEQAGEQNIESLVSHDMLPEQRMEQQELQKVLKEGIMQLKKNEQIVLSLYYRKELKMKEIAEVMQLSKPRISQIHARALCKLRVYIEKNYTLGGTDDVSGVL